MRQTSPKNASDTSASQGQSSQQSTTETSSNKSPTDHHAASTITPASSLNSLSSNATNTPTEKAEKASSQEAEDFFARAKAMGLNLTRQDYERARAGVSAFLKAQRVEKTDTTSSPSLGESSGTTGGNNSNVIGTSESLSVNADGGLGSAKIASQSKFTTTRSTCSPMLSFFTAVVPTEEEESQNRPSLDDVVALEERKRRRERRKRIKERRERHGDKSATSTHVKEVSLTSTLLDGSPLTINSVDASGDGAGTSLLRTDRFGKATLASDEIWPGRVGLGLQIEGGLVSGEVEGEIDQIERLRSRKVSNEQVSYLQSPAQLSKSITLSTQSPGLRTISRKAHIDSDGRLTLMATPNQRQMNDEMLVEEDVVALTNNGAETDDSGVFLVADSGKMEWNRQRRPSSNETSPLLDLHESLDKMSFLDRVMAQKRSPLRLKREARAREKEAKMSTRQDDLIVMTATAATTTTGPSLAQSALQPVSRQREKTVDGQQCKTVRWAHSSSSPRQRMTTKEHYDFAFYGIAPNPSEMTGSMPTYYDEDMKRNVSEAADDIPFHIRQRTVSNWMRPHLGQSNLGSPVATRGTTLMTQDSPGVLSLGLESMADRIDALGAANMSARRGLLFGPSTGSNDRTPPVSTIGYHEYSQGPTLARSPARNVFDSYTISTPTGMSRSVSTLAAPFSYHNQTGIDGERLRNGMDESPDKVMLMRAHSSGALERRLPGHLRQTSLLAKDTGKESNSPENVARGKKAVAGWAHRRSISRSDTISPAAIFGTSSSQPNRIRIFSGEIHEMGRLPLVEQIKDQPGFNDQDANSDEEGDDERDFDGSPAIDSSGAGRHNRSQLQTLNYGNNHNRDSSASTSVFEGSPMFLDLQNRTASIVNAIPSSSILANALQMSGEERGIESQRKESSQSVKTKKKKKKGQEGAKMKQQQLQFAPLQTETNRDATAGQISSSQTFLSSDSFKGSTTNGQTEWDKPDGTRVVKLISEELQAALESGSLPAEPPARYYKLPPDWGQSKTKPLSVSYAGMIGQALLSSSDGRLSLNEIYNWISTVFPFFERGDRGWQNSIRHNLSLNKSFIKVEREAHIPGKGGWWAIKQGHEDRFKGGSYVAPGSTLSQKSGSKMSLFVKPKDEEISHWTPLQKEEIAEAELQTLRRKREESDNRSEVLYDQASDSDYQPSGQVIKPSKKTKKVKVVGTSTKKGRPAMNTAFLPALEGEKQSNLGLLSKRVSLRPVQSSSPQDTSFDAITPHRSHQFVASSGHGSTSTASIMAGMPMLTDASSPPSSPNTNNFDILMPPPSGGIHGAASSQSAQKRKKAVNRAVDLMNSSSGYQQHHSNFGSQNISLHSNATIGYNPLSAHTLQASPLAHMRSSNNGNINGSILANNARLRAGPGHSLMNAMDSPLRRHGNSIDSNSPSRMFVNSPVSSLRDHHYDNTSMSMERSTTETNGDADKENQNPSPQRGSPMRLSSQFAGSHHLQQQQQYNFQSSAGMNLQMAVGPSNAIGSQHLGSTPTRYTDQNNGNFLHQKWSLSPSPGKGLRYTAMANAPNMYSHNANMISQGNGSTSNALEDPFDYSGNLQHELEFAQFDGVSESPMKMAYPQVVRNQFINGQQQQQQQQQQHLQYLSNGSSYSSNLAPSQAFGSQ